METVAPRISRRRLLARMIGGENVGAADVAVTINNFAFSPTPLTVPVGTRVV